MALAKKKPSAAQIAARKRFAAAAKAGTLRKGSRLSKAPMKHARNPAPRKRNPIRPTAGAAALKRPSSALVQGNPKSRASGVAVTNVKTGKTVARFANRARAVEYAHAIADKTGHVHSVG